MDNSVEHLAPPESPVPAALQEVEQRVARVNDTVISFVRERPVTCLVGAVALGFIVGKLAARF